MVWNDIFPSRLQLSCAAIAALIAAGVLIAWPGVSFAQSGNTTATNAAQAALGAAQGALNAAQGTTAGAQGAAGALGRGAAQGRGGRGPQLPPVVWDDPIFKLNATGLTWAKDLKPELYFQNDFPMEELKARREKVYPMIGDAVAIVAGAPPVRGFSDFRQNNEIYYLCGVERSMAYIILDGRTKKSTLVVPHRDKRVESAEGREIGSEDAEMLMKLTGVEAVIGPEDIEKALAGASKVYTPFQPAEGITGSRDELMKGNRYQAADPWDQTPTREQIVQNHIKEKLPNAQIADLSPILDSLRSFKTPREITLLRRAGQLSALGIVESMKSTKPGVTEYNLDAASRYIYALNGSKFLGYRAIAASGPNIPNMHYYRNNRTLEAGDQILMDFAPDFGNYTSDIGRMWPVNGKYPEYMRELYGFVIKYHTTLLKLLRPHVTSAQIRAELVHEMTPVLEGWKWSKPEYKQAAQTLLLTGGGDFSHNVGMAVHDVGTSSRIATGLQPGQVFSIDPAIRVPSENLYIRCEDTIVITEDGHENFTRLAPYDLDEVEALVQKGGGVVMTSPPVPPMEIIDVKGTPPADFKYDPARDGVLTSGGLGEGRGRGGRGRRGADGAAGAGGAQTGGPAGAAATAR